jgi:hypothetical protein
MQQLEALDQTCHRRCGGNTRHPVRACAWRMYLRRPGIRVSGQRFSLADSAGSGLNSGIHRIWLQRQLRAAGAACHRAVRARHFQGLAAEQALEVCPRLGWPGLPRTNYLGLTCILERRRIGSTARPCGNIPQTPCPASPATSSQPATTPRGRTTTLPAPIATISMYVAARDGACKC